VAGFFALLDLFLLGREVYSVGRKAPSLRLMASLSQPRGKECHTHVPEPTVTGSTHPRGTQGGIPEYTY